MKAIINVYDDRTEMVRDVFTLTTRVTPERDLGMCIMRSNDAAVEAGATSVEVIDKRVPAVPKMQ